MQRGQVARRDLVEQGGPDLGVHVYTRDEASGTREVFWKKLLEKGPIVEGAVVVKSNGAMKTAVAGDEGAVGYIGFDGNMDVAIAIRTIGSRRRAS